MSRTTGMLGAAVLACAWFSANSHAQQAPPRVDFADQTVSAEARYAAHWIVAAADHEGQPFAVVDKSAAQVFVFAGDGRLLGASAALLGLAPGDRASTGPGKVDVSRLAPAERTTPAGRFMTEPGRNRRGEAIVWLDYDAALALHRLRPADPLERRPQRLASATPADNRISLGCVVVPVAFYDQVVAPTLGRQRGVIYVLPEDRPARQMFAAWEAARDQH